MEPDGPSEREAFYDESTAADLDRIECEEAESDVGYHTNDFGEIVAHAVTVWPREVKL